MKTPTPATKPLLGAFLIALLAACATTTPHKPLSEAGGVCLDYTTLMNSTDSLFNKGVLSVQ
jgi:hypothetical protein